MHSPKNIGKNFTSNRQATFFLLTPGTAVTILTNPKMTARAMTVASAQAVLTMLGTNQANGAVAVLTTEPSWLEEKF